jgi:hypothetical protein
LECNIILILFLSILLLFHIFSSIHHENNILLRSLMRVFCERSWTFMNVLMSNWNSTNVKLKFVKTFFLPYFNYCISLVISYIKTAIQKLCILYYNFLHKLFKFQLNEREVNWVNDFWKRFNLFSFQHRIFYRLSIFTYNSKSKFELRKNSDKEIEIGYELRNKDKYIAVEYELVAGKKTKAYFFNNFKNAWFHLFW